MYIFICCFSVSLLLISVHWIRTCNRIIMCGTERARANEHCQCSSLVIFKSNETEKKHFYRRLNSNISLSAIVFKLFDVLFFSQFKFLKIEIIFVVYSRDSLFDRRNKQNFDLIPQKQTQKKKKNFSAWHFFWCNYLFIVPIAKIFSLFIFLRSLTIIRHAVCQHRISNG